MVWLSSVYQMEFLISCRVRDAQVRPDTIWAHRMPGSGEARPKPSMPDGHGAGQGFSNGHTYAVVQSFLPSDSRYRSNGTKRDLMCSEIRIVIFSNAQI